MSAPSLERILYVDDDGDVQQVVAMSLEVDAGFEVRTCGSGAEAIVIARTFRPDLILLDVMMPDMDGPTTLSTLRADGDLADTPVIFLTAKAQKTEVDRLRALGAIDVISKPFSPMTLAARVREIWMSHHPEGPSEISDRLARLGHEFAVRSRGDASRLSELQRALLSSDPDLAAAAVREIEVIAHRLRGTAGTLGFATVSEAAAWVEDAVGVLGGQGVLVEPDAARALAAKIEQLVSEIDRLPD